MDNVKIKKRSLELSLKYLCPPKILNFIFLLFQTVMVATIDFFCFCEYFSYLKFIKFLWSVLTGDKGKENPRNPLMRAPNKLVLARFIKNLNETH